MATCPYCGKSAGIFRKKHSDCEELYLSGKGKLRKYLEQYFETDNSIEIKRIKSICKDYYIKDYERNKIIIEVWTGQTTLYLSDNILSIEEEKKLDDFQQLTNEFDIDWNYNYNSHTIMKAVIIREIVAGNIDKAVNRVSIVNNPIVLEKNDVPIWVFQYIPLLQEKTKKEYVGGSSGVSVRVMKGVYYRTSAFKGYPIETPYLSEIDSGVLLLGLNNLYYSGSNKAFKIPYKKIISFQPYEDGVKIFKEPSTSKPMIFKVDDGWFLNNVIANMIELNK